MALWMLLPTECPSPEPDPPLRKASLSRGREGGKGGKAEVPGQKHPQPERQLLAWLRGLRFCSEAP